MLFVAVSVFSLFLVLLFNLLFTPRKYASFVVQYSAMYELDNSLVYSIIRVESNFNAEARSAAGALGLMQIMPNTAAGIAEALGEEFDTQNLLDAETNIKYGCFYLNYLFFKFKDLDTVICAYNAGEGNVKKWLNFDGKIDIDKIDFVETKNYLMRVKKYLSMYKVEI